MNRKETRKAIEVMQAYVDGAEIECLSKKINYESERDWYTEEPMWHWPSWEYRIKPKPREFWIWHSADGETLWREIYGPDDDDRDAIKVVEVIE